MGLKEKMLDFLMKRNQAKKVVKILILDPLKGITTDYWEYEEHKELIDKWVGADGTLYMLCVYENGEPDYFATSKDVFYSTKNRIM